jgi:hypothetical protein
MFKNVLFIAAFIFSTSAFALENGIYDCEFQGFDGQSLEWSFQLTDSSLLFIGDSEDNLYWNPESMGEWFQQEGEDSNDGWVTQYKVIREKTGLVIFADNQSVEGDMREMVTSIFTLVPGHSDIYSFTFIDQILDAYGNVLETDSYDVSYCRKK